MTELTTLPEVGSMGEELALEAPAEDVPVWETPRYWLDEREMLIEYMEVRHKLWKKLFSSYSLDFNIPGMSKTQIIHISKMYPRVRQLLASLAFTHPHIFVEAKPLVENENVDLALVARIYERVINEALDTMDFVKELRQGLFYMIFTGICWLKVGYNYQGDDIEAPYTVNDRFKDNFPFVQAKKSVNMFVPPVCPPHDIGLSPYVAERMFIPYEQLEKDTEIDPEVLLRLKHSVSGEVEGSEKFGMPSDLGRNALAGESKALSDSNTSQKMVEIWEFHDRLHRKRCWVSPFITDAFVKDPEIHPFVVTQPVYGQDEAGNQVLQSLEPQQDFIMQNGTQYVAIKIDTDSDSFWPMPAMAYIADPERLQIESVSRRADGLKRFSRILGVSKAENVANPRIKQQLKKAEDGDVITFVNMGMEHVRELTWGSVPSDQRTLELDAQRYEAEIMDIGGSNIPQDTKRRTGTEVSDLIAQGALNREWSIQAVAFGYETVARNILRMFRDVRFISPDFIQNIAGDESQAVMEALTTETFKFEYMLEIDLESMLPFIAQKDREEAILLYDRFLNDPDIDQLELKKMLLGSARVSTPERLLKGRGAIEAIRAAQIENLMALITGTVPPVVPGQNHIVHSKEHAVERIQELPEFLNAAPAQQMESLNLIAQHTMEHQAALEFEAAGGGGGSGGGAKSQPDGVNGQIIARGQAGQMDLAKQVQSNAQEFFASVNQGATLDR